MYIHIYSSLSYIAVRVLLLHKYHLYQNNNNRTKWKVEAQPNQTKKLNKIKEKNLEAK